jgi:hypothetical protein
MARPIRVQLGAVAASNPIPLDLSMPSFSVTLAADVSAGGTLTYFVEQTFDNVFSPTFNPATATWFTVFTASADQVGSLTAPATAVRLRVSAYTSGSVTLTIIQSGF